ncbi:hypothetical protein [Pedobacter sp. Leaf176]|uniref:hypothetical protein n=1 Tax=Pedobacter sp. Leaf176 TaxID=1736286 RepID=UPI0006F63776|nr:hypothetical protein [Pedobacter sp. Leaf176]KQR72333.1 hypothetical protein ASF92_03325 [Pedobacter sp. Leaf176]
MPEDYQDAVLAAYKQKQKKEDEKLPLFLLRPTAVKLKKACLRKYDASEEARDIFSEFFNKDRINTDFSSIISKADEGCFRPLLNHLNGVTARTDEKNTELLAWLIDFQPRPSITYYKNQFPDRGAPPTPPTPPVPPPKKNQLKVYSIILKTSITFITLFIITIAYVFWKKNKDKNIREASSTEQCMYWTGLHYEPIACDDKDVTKLKLPLNKEQLASQQKITEPDTLTAHSLGKVWYGKINSKPEFYTDSGTNPQDTTKRLLPLTQYMLHKYVSYDRYRLEVLIWSVSLLALFGVLAGAAYRYRPKKY